MERPTVPLPPTLAFAVSPVHGWGVFSLIDIPANTNLGEFIGEYMNHKTFTERYGSDRRYVYMKQRTWEYRVAKEKRNWITYINDGKHGFAKSEVNVCLKNWCCYTTRAIKPWEELFLDYGRYYRWDLCEKVE